MSIERLMALEKDIRNSGGPGCQYHADQLASLIAELGQEVGAVAWQTQLADSLSCFWNAAIGAEVTSHDSTARATASAIAQGFAAVEARLREFAHPSPAHTSEARDAARLDWLEKHGCWRFAGPNESDIRGYPYRWFDYDTQGSDYSATLRDAIDGAMRQAVDAAMRQEGGNG